MRERLRRMLRRRNAPAAEPQPGSIDFFLETHSTFEMDMRLKRITGLRLRLCAHGATDVLAELDAERSALMDARVERMLPARLTRTRRP